MPRDERTETVGESTGVPIEQKESIRRLENIRCSTELLDHAPRCVHIGDRESDIYESLCMAEQRGTKFLVRTWVDRLAGDGQHTIAVDMRGTKVNATYRIEVRDAARTLSEEAVEVRYRRLRVQPPIGKQKIYPSLTRTVIHAQERTIPRGRKKVDWKLITNLPVQSRRDALEKLSWYTMRWKIEAFHNILTSGVKQKLPSSVLLRELAIPLLFSAFSADAFSG